MQRSDIIQSVEDSLSTGQQPFLSQLHQLDAICKEIQHFYHEYDFKAEIPGNGFRTIVKITDIYFKKLKHELDLGNLSLHSDLLKDYTTLAHTLSKSLSVAMGVRGKGVDFTLSTITDQDVSIWKKLFAVTAEDLEPVYGSLSCFYYKEGVQSTYNGILFLWHFLASSLTQRIRMLTSSSFASKHRANLANHLNVSIMKCLDPQFPLDMITRLLAAAFSRGVSIRRMSLECRSRFTVSLPDPVSPAVVTESHGRTSSVKTYFIVPSEVKSRSVILHCPGGGYVIGHPEQFVMVLSHYAKEFSCPVITVNYEKAPQHPYPSALQELLDLYLFLTSGEDRVMQLIGFHPDKVILSGDSAGANLCMSAIIAMHRIKKGLGAGKRDEVRMPDALVTWYPYFLPSFVAMPSYSLLPVCSMTQPGVLATINVAYAGTKVTDDLWYKKQGAGEFMKSHNPRVSDALFNNFVFDGFDDEDIKKIDLHLIAAEMDPLLDHAVLMAKRWKGRVHLEIVHNMPHAFNVLPQHPAIQKEGRRVMDHYAQALGKGTLL